MAHFRAPASYSTTTADTKDVELVFPPSDSISALAFSSGVVNGPTDFLAVASWDNTVKLYEVNNQRQSQGKAEYAHGGPVLDVCWSKDATRLFSGGADNAVRMFDLNSGANMQVGAHEAPVRNVRWIDSPTGSILATASWDKTIKYWDLRTPNAIASVNLPERVYSMDIHYPLCVVGTAEKQIHIINLTSPTTIFKTTPSPLKLQTRVISCFGPGGYAVGSVEGRVAFQYMDEKDTKNNFSFRCHREDQNNKTAQAVYSVNAISFHPVYGTFSTAGADGTIAFWDKDSKTRLKNFPRSPGPISATSFNKTGNILAYAISYDWSKGHSGMVPSLPNKVMLHAVKDEDIKNKSRK